MVTVGTVPSMSTVRPPARRHPRRSRSLVVLAVLTICAPLLASLGERKAVAATPSASTPASGGSIVVASANLREGAVVFPAADRRDASDLRTFARRYVARARGSAADVLILQEVRGSAKRATRILNQRLRATGRTDRYRMVLRPRKAMTTQRCGPVAKPGRHLTLRGSALLLNTRTVRDVHRTGVIRTWGRWRLARGCAEHPWARVTVKRPGEAARSALVLGVHVHPVGDRRKQQALSRFPRLVERLREPGDLAVMAGDFNKPRCAYAAAEYERVGCEIRPAHRAILEAGYVDTIRATRAAGPSPAGVSHRIDFIYTDGPVRAAWFDRCYLAFRARDCAPGQLTLEQFLACQDRADFHGTPGGGCSRAAYGRYYSDHPFLLARVG